MKKLILYVILLMPTILPGQVKKPTIVILGVSHSGQLVNYYQQPAAL
jgi:hypothetical protein